MSNAASETLSVTVERDLPFAPEKVWRALTQPHLIAEWLMQNDFSPMAGHRFTLRADWGSVDCEVRIVEPNKALSYTWNAMGLESVVTWTLTPTEMGTQLRMEQSGFRPDQKQAYSGAKYGWQQFLGKLEQVLARDASPAASGRGGVTDMSNLARRPLYRWIHIVCSIPIIGYIYSPFDKIPDYAPATRFVFLPVMLLTGLWMWKGHVVLRVLSRNPAPQAPAQSSMELPEIGSGR